MLERGERAKEGGHGHETRCVGEIEDDVDDAVGHLNEWVVRAVDLRQRRWVSARVGGWCM